MSDSLYSEKIMSHYYRPRNYGLWPEFSAEQRYSNPLCGDVITVRMRFIGEQIAGVCFEHEGCVISRAAASLLFEDIQGKTKQEIREMTYMHIEGLLGITVMPARMKCALAALEAIQRMV
ncbi:MAG: iron-sulfur cluster assembly scaffold protein [Candidatus Sungbacteria bacterium]|nr:iron-sulfur cluster assembly scaffold protein [Candidatus Sungbacteria bacterium]